MPWQQVQVVKLKPADSLSIVALFVCETGQEVKDMYGAERQYGWMKKGGRKGNQRSGCELVSSENKFPVIRNTIARTHDVLAVFEFGYMNGIQSMYTPLFNHFHCQL